MNDLLVRYYGMLRSAVILIPCVFVLVAILDRTIMQSRESIPPEPADERIESVDFVVVEGDRSSQWSSIRNEFVSRNPFCAACGSRKDLNVHHIKPFHSNPELELDMKNLITLCREHHFRIGHDPDGPWKPRTPSWKESNPMVRKHSQMWRDSR
jgi:5-methylcytosine-specific restriction endonuclease McrA